MASAALGFLTLIALAACMPVPPEADTPGTEAVGLPSAGFTAQPPGGYPNSQSGPEPIDRYRRLLPLLLGGQAEGGASTASSTTLPDANLAGTPSASGSTPAAGVATSGGSCPAGMLRREGEGLTMDGQKVVFFGINVPFLLDSEFPESEVEPIVRDLAARGVNVIRVWFFSNKDPDRLERLLGLGQKYGVRFVVTLEDNVFKGVEWFFGDADEKKYRPHLQRTVERFKDRPEILMWELINEPNCNGPADDDCEKIIRDWVKVASTMIREIDKCHIISSGMLGAGPQENQQDTYKRIHSRDAIAIFSVHRRSDEDRDVELSIAKDEGKPLYYGEIFDEAYDEGCQPIDGELRKRAERIKDDLEAAIDDDGVDGYMLWEYAAGLITRNNGDPKDYCSTFGFYADDPLWQKLREAELPPRVPWQRQKATP